MRILLADDQPGVCSALRLLLEQEPGLRVVGEAAEAEELLAQMQAACPDLVLLDWELPGLDAASLPSALRLRYPQLRVIALSGRPEARQAALQAGADAFVSKGDPPERLLATLRGAFDFCRGPCYTFLGHCNLHIAGKEKSLTCHTVPFLDVN
jgi:DNA-binding NarL/FixJ family response regulator